MDLNLIRAGGLAHLSLDTDAALVNPSFALFSPCRGGHLSSQTCQAWDQVETTLPPPPRCRPYRYALTRTWMPHRPPAAFVLLNPSTADAFQLDPTLRRCADFARRWRCGGMVVVNAFALRSTNPSALRGHPDPTGPDNDAVIAAVLTAGPLGRVVVGWGTDPVVARSGRATAILKVVRGAGHEPLSLAVNADGSPKHPLYVSRWTRPALYLGGDDG